MSIVERIQELHYITDDDGCCCAGCDEAWPCAEYRAAELLQRAVEMLKEYAPEHRFGIGTYREGLLYPDARALIEEIEGE